MEVRTLSFWRGRLPHWEVADGVYFVTLRVAGCLPVTVRRELDATLADVDESDYVIKSRRYFVKLEQWLDHHHEIEWLTEPDVAQVIEAAFSEYEAQGVWKLHAYVVMPNHLHWFFSPGNRSMSQAVRGFKRFTGRECNVVLRREGKRFWEVEWFDHWSRGSRESERIVSYIRSNPVKAGLVKRPEDWPHMK